MRTLQLSIIAGNLLAVGLLASNTASGVDLCEHLGRCENGCYTNVSKKTAIPSELESSSCDTAALAMEPGGEYVTYKIPLDLAPGPLSLECAKQGNGVLCEVWPQGESITYTWSAGSSFVPDASTGAANPVRGFACAPGTQAAVTVTAFSPAGASSTLTQTVSCPSTP